MTREQKYTEQLQQLGIWQPAFAPAVRTLADMERDHQRTWKAWKDEGSLIDSPLYAAVVQQRRDILQHRDALGLTPRGLRRLKSSTIVPEDLGPTDTQGGSPAVSALLDGLRARAAANANVSESDTAADG